MSFAVFILLDCGIQSKEAVRVIAYLVIFAPPKRYFLDSRNSAIARMKSTEPNAAVII
mgnify:CR=1 FL=1